MKCYIRGLGNVSPQNTCDNQQFLNEIVIHDSDYLESIEPNYKDLINPLQLRRMSRIIKMGIAASQICLDDAGISMPDAIITGTGLGCMSDTEKFLVKMIDFNEQYLTPTPFIQSTHNTIGAQIAVRINCNNYNFTYTQRGISFESALIDSQLLLNEGEAKNVLAGGFDEVTPNHFKVWQRIKYWKSERINHLELLKHDSSFGSIAGEGMTFFMLSSEKSDSNYAQMFDVQTVYKPHNISDVETALLKCLETNGLTTEDIDVVVLGLNGDYLFDNIYHEICNKLFTNSVHTYFKHLCGEYHTASAFGLWTAAKMIKHQQIPEILKLTSNKPNQIKNILLYNHYRNINHSFILLSKC